MPQHVLIIDDDGAIRDMLALYLRGRGYTVSVAADGEAGLAQCRLERPDLILCDLRMPGQDGLTVLAEVSANCPDLPVVIVSGNADTGDAIQALRLGAWDYVTKPIMDLGVLDRAIERSLERLDPAFREPFTMHHEGFKYHEIAEHLNIPIGTVKSRIHQARQRLMTMLSDKHLAN